VVSCHRIPGAGYLPTIKRMAFSLSPGDLTFTGGRNWDFSSWKIKLEDPKMGSGGKGWAPFGRTKNALYL